MPGAGQVLLGLAGDVARVARVRLQRQRVVHEEVAGQRLALAERVDPRGGHVRQQRHVRLVDRLEALDGRAVERHAAGQRIDRDARGRDGEVIHDAQQIAEPDVEDLDVILSDVGDQLFGGGEHARAPCRRGTTVVAGTVQRRPGGLTARGEAGPARSGPLETGPVGQDLIRWHRSASWQVCGIRLDAGGPDRHAWPR